MKKKGMMFGLAASAVFSVFGRTITPSGDTTGAQDTSTIQSAIDAAANGTVTLDSGMFFINVQLNVHGGVTLQGQGWDKTVVKQVATTPDEETRVAMVTDGSSVRNLTLTGGRIKSTGSYKYGGGVLLKNGTISWCCITNNAVDCKSYGVGGGVGIPQSKGTIDHSIIADNEVKSASGNKSHGGGIGVYLPGGQITVDSCLVRGNRALITSDGSGYGGGLAVDWSGFSNPVTVRNTTFVGNSIGVKGGSGTTWGAGVYSDDDKSKKLTMINCIFAENTAANSSVKGDVNDSSNTAYSYTIFQGNACVGTVDYCCFDKAQDVVGANSVSGSEIFTNASAGDYTLSSSSPAKGAGTTYTGISTDLSGTVFASRPSIGCYEFGSTPTIIPTDPGEGQDQDDPGEGESGGQGEEDSPHVDPSGALSPSGSDDAEAIQSALDVASANAVVTLGAGTFFISKTLELSKGVSLLGQGADKTKIIPVSGRSISCVKLEGGAKLEGLTVTGGKTGDGAGVKVVDGTISWCTITGNAGSCGGGVCFSNGKGRIDHSIVSNNTGSGAGGGIGMTSLAGDVVIDTCLICNNASTAGSGGGIAVVSGSGKTVTIISSTVTGNSTRYNAGGVHLKSSDAVLTNCILEGNTAASGGGVSGYANLPDLTVENSSVAGSDYCFFGTSQEVVGTHSASGSAPFVGSGNYHLSSAKELGYTDNTGTCVDLDGKTRSGALDVGCYEFGGTTPPEPQHTHVWGTPFYVWTAVSGGYTCKASAVCTSDGSHTTNLTVTASYKVTKEPTTEATGTGTYTATFAAPFATQTKDVTLAKLPKEDPPHVDPSDAAQPSGDATGATDAKTIQDLIDAAAPSHGSVVLGSGVFVVNAQLMITNGVTLIGQGWAQTVIKAASGKSIRLATIDDDAKLEKVTLTGGKSADGAGAAVKDGTVSWCCVSNNVGTSGYGAGVSFSNGRGQIDHSIVANNSQSGAAYGAGIGMNNQTGSVTIDTCLIYGNACSSGSGGGVMAEHIGSGKAVMILNCTITGNTTRYNAGGVHVKNGDNGTCVLINDILSGNKAGTNTPNNPDLTLENALATGSAYCLFGMDAEWKNVKGISNSLSGTAPFVGNGDYHLSQALELDYETDDATSVDLDNLARSGRVDVGCYEFGGTPYVERPGLTIYVD